MNHNRFLGYTKDESGHLIIDPEQAEIVKRIFYEYLQGKSLQQIGDGLMADGILTAAGKKIWRGETIRKILKNEKYMGDALRQKTYTVDCLTKKRVKQYWGRHMWARGYFVTSSGNVTDEIIAEYIKNQALEERQNSDNFNISQL